MNPLGRRLDATAKMTWIRYNAGVVFRRTAHAAYDTAYHLVWSPKYRKQILQGVIAERVREMFAEIAQQY
ncbi:MAG: transposase, partial [Blastocatellia bacterium]